MYLFKILVFFGYIPRSGIAGSILATLVFRFFFFNEAPIYIPTDGMREFPFLHTLSGLYYL